MWVLLGNCVGGFFVGQDATEGSKLDVCNGAVEVLDGGVGETVAEAGGGDAVFCA